MPAFEEEWSQALEESRRTFSLNTLYEVVHAWQARLATITIVLTDSADAAVDAPFTVAAL